MYVCIHVYMSNMFFYHSIKSTLRLHPYNYTYVPMVIDGMSRRVVPPTWSLDLPTPPYLLVNLINSIQLDLTMPTHSLLVRNWRIGDIRAYIYPFSYSPITLLHEMNGFA